MSVRVKGSETVLSTPVIRSRLSFADKSHDSMNEFGIDPETIVEFEKPRGSASDNDERARTKKFKDQLHDPIKTSNNLFFLVYSLFANNNSSLYQSSFPS